MSGFNIQNQIMYFIFSKRVLRTWLSMLKHKKHFLSHRRELRPCAHLQYWNDIRNTFIQWFEMLAQWLQEKAQQIAPSSSSEGVARPRPVIETVSSPNTQNVNMNIRAQLYTLRLKPDDSALYGHCERKNPLTRNLQSFPCP